MSRRWRLATLEVAVAVGIVVWAVLAYLGVGRWDDFVEATGGSTHDCHYAENDCGVLGEFTEAHPLILLSLIAAVAAIPATATVWLVTRFFDLLRDPAGRQGGPAVSQH